MSVFDAWSLPPETPDAPETARVACEPGGGTLRHPVVGADGIGRIVEGLRRARRTVLLERSVGEIRGVLGGVGARFLDPDDRLRREAVALLPPVNGISGAMAREVVTGMARDWTEERLDALLRSELGEKEVLDGFRPGPGGARVRALGPEVTLHVSAGTVPGVSVTSLLRGLLLKSASLVKPGRGDAVLPVLFARGLREADAELASAVAVLYWPGGEAEAEDAALDLTDAVVAYGSDRAIDSLRARTPATSRFVAYRHRLSLAMVGRDALSDAEGARSVAGAAARAVALFDQRGCVSPHVCYVEEGGGRNPEEWARLLAAALEALEEELPSGALLPSEASELQQLRGAAEIEEAAGRGRIHHGGDAPWTVVLEPEPGLRPSCLGRVVRVRPVSRLQEALRELDGISERLQTVALDGVDADRREALAEALARRGALRITTLEKMPFPPSWWHHDGLGPLGALVRWIDLEGGGTPASG